MVPAHFPLQQELADFTHRETSISLQTSNDLDVTFTWTTILSGLKIKSLEHTKS